MTEVIPDKFCECGEPAIRRKMGSYVCAFCDWCQLNGMNGGPDDERHLNRAKKEELFPKPTVPRIPEWDELREEIIALHGNKKFWAQRNSNAERFNQLFRGRKSEPSNPSEKN